MSTEHSIAAPGGTASQGAGSSGPGGELDDDVILAAGCVVYRFGADGPEVLVVHRPLYDDWDLPKGKQEPGETADSCAVRETAEESGYHGELGPELASDTYRVRGRDKQVRWFLLHCTGGSFEPNDEVDRVQWLSPDEARDILSYGHARSLLDAVPEVADVTASSDDEEE